MLQKRGQLTIFIIIAIFIVGSTILFYSFRTGILTNIFSPEVGKVNSFVQDCIEEESHKIIYQIGENGGYFLPPNTSTDSGVAIYNSNGSNHMPSKKEVEEEISFFMDEKLFFCTRSFINFPELEITQKRIQTETQIENDKVILKINYPISISKESSTNLISDFKFEVPLRIGIIYDSIAEFMKQETSDSICLSCLLDVTLENDLYVDMIDYDERTTIFLFRDENFKINNETFVWVFANEYEIG